MQIEAIDAFVSRQDTFVSLPTGYGKSAIFATLPLVFVKLRGKISWIPIYTTVLKI